MSIDNLGMEGPSNLPDLELSSEPRLAPYSALVPLRSRVLHGIAARMRGPGGYYNIGNAVGLAGGLSLAVLNGSIAGAGGVATAAWTYLVGNGSAVALTVATLVFFWSGEVYHRAWSDREQPDARLNRQGDLLSALGAVALGLSLALLGLPLLAATAGVLHAVGKLGSALHSPGTSALPGWPPPWSDPFRSVVLLSRAPAILVAALALVGGLSGSKPAEVMPVLLGPGVLLVCNLLWAKADLLLLRPAN